MDYRVTDSQQLSLLLESLRKAKGLSQTHVGMLLGMSQQSYSRIVANPGSTSFDTVLRLLLALGADLTINERPSDPPHGAHAALGKRANRHADVPAQAQLLASGDRSRPTSAVKDVYMTAKALQAREKNPTTTGTARHADVSLDVLASDETSRTPSTARELQRHAWTERIAPLPKKKSW